MKNETKKQKKWNEKKKWNLPVKKQQGPTVKDKRKKKKFFLAVGEMIVGEVTLSVK